MFASRVFMYDDGTGRRVEIEARIEAPLWNDTSYSCEFSARGGGLVLAEGTGMGADSMQALTNAMRGLRRGLEPYDSRLEWAGTEGHALGIIVAVGDAAFRKVVEALEQERAQAILDAYKKRRAGD